MARGFLMIVMALDHVRDYLGARTGNPTDPATTTLALFTTRWITHVCAPGFCLLTGIGARLALGHRGRGALSRFLWTRGLWLIALDAIVLRCLAYQFNFDFHFTVLNVLWMLGWSMIALGALIYLPSGAIAAVGAVLVMGHNLLDGVAATTLGVWAPVWRVLHVPGIIVATPSHVVFEAYPLVPWIGVIALGWTLGAVYAWPAERRRALLIQLGLGLIVGFVVLRAVDLYGDPSRWVGQANALRTALSFLNTTKYPPSLLFLLMTLGPVLLLLHMAETAPRWLEPVRIIGTVPLFYFAVHFALIHLAAVTVSALRFGTIRGMFESPSLDRYPFTMPPGWGFELLGVYLAWIVIVLAVYPLCRWYAAYKRARHHWWLSYL